MRHETDTVDIRAAREADVEEILGLWRESAAHATVTDDAAGIITLLTHAPGSLLVAVEAGAVIGTVIAGWNGWRGSIYRIAVHPGQRRRRIAQTLLDCAVRRLEAQGARRIDAFVVEDDALARSFWDALPPPWGPDPLDKLRYVRMAD